MCGDGQVFFMNQSLDFSVLVKVTQINYVSRNQLHSTANGCQHLNFGLMCKGKTLPGVVNNLFIFSSALCRIGTKIQISLR
jgi:hypothetical protein